MAESGITIGSLLAMLFGTIIMMGILQPVMTFAGVYNPNMNSTTPAGQYITSLYGNNGIANYTNRSVGTIGTIPFGTSANQSSSAISPSSLAQTSGFAFIAGGLSTFWNALKAFPGLLVTIFTQSLNYGEFKSLLPIDLAGLITVVLFSYVSALLALKLISIISKPGQSVENI